MPYTQSTLPDNIKKLSETRQRQWMHIFNSCDADGKPESKCFAMANGVVKKAGTKDLGPITADEALVLVEGAKYYQYVESYDYADRAISQEAAGYDPLGASATQGCANCQWFIPPGRCSVVAGTISPTGLSSLWRPIEVYSPAPIPVTIVDSTEGAKSADSGSSAQPNGLLDGLRNLVSRYSPFNTASGPSPVPAVPQPFTLYRQKDGQLRFLTAWSNNFTDREGEIFPESAHKEYIEWADRNQQYPELWLWHTKGTKYGQVDWLDYTDGFVYASGLIDAGFEVLAETLVKEDCGVSHGFHGLQRGKEIILYRPFEISTLPRTNAAVWTTSFNIIGEGAKEMAFTQQKKDWLKQHGLDDAAIAAAEMQATALSKSLKDLGIAYKDSDIVDEPTATADDKAAKPPKDDEEDDPKKKGNPYAKEFSDFQSAMLVQANKQTEILSGLATTMASLDTRLKAVEATDDQKIAATIAARTPPNGGVSASKDATNVVEQAQSTADQEWFGKVFVAPLATGAQ